MENALLYVGMAVLALGSAGLALTALRAASGKIAKQRAGSEALFGVGALLMGLYLVLDANALLLAAVVVITAAGIFEARTKRAATGSGSPKVE